MDLKIIFAFMLFVIFYGFYSINLYLYKYKKIKYWISLGFSIAGLGGWVLIWFKIGWLTMAVNSTALLLLSVISFLIAVIIDFVVKKTNRQNNKEG